MNLLTETVSGTLERYVNGRGCATCHHYRAESAGYDEFVCTNRDSESFENFFESFDYCSLWRKDEDLYKEWGL